jgi:5'-methylthioadenosine phosphorylase
MAQLKTAEIAIIGGSGLYEMDGLKQQAEVRPATPFGRPSDAVKLGTFHGRRVAFLARHGHGHRLSPSAINYRANIWALKSLGVKQIFSVSAVGSMKKGIHPGHLVIPNQFIDRTLHRIGTFFDQGLVAHVAFADPICHNLADVILRSAKSVGVKFHKGGTYICMEGPQFSTRAESQLYRKWGVDVIGMTNLPEAKLAREAEMCYATLALVTDYDCWHETEEAVSVGAILEVMHQNVTMAKHVLSHAIQMVTDSIGCGCPTALDHALVTSLDVIPQSTQQRFALLLGKRGVPKMKKKRSR